MIHKHEVHGALEGYVTLELPRYVERLELMEKLSMGYKEGELELSKKVAPAKELYLALEKRIKEVSLKCGDVELKSLEDLEYYQEGVELINQLGAILMGGVRLGKN